jgi:hypothetical protein
MAHFAKVENGVVREVIVIGNGDAPTEAAGKAVHRQHRTCW